MLRGVDGRDDFDDAEGTARQPGRVSSIESRLRREPAESVQAPDIDRGRRGLVVEDERTIRHSISGYLQDAGYTADEAENGAEARNAMRHAIPEVLGLN